MAFRKKAFLKYFIIVAIGTILYIKLCLTKFISEQEINKKLRKIKMNKQINLGD